MDRLGVFLIFGVLGPLITGQAMAPPPGRRKRKLRREELAVLASVIGTAVVIVQRFLEENDLLLLPSQTMALEASVQATTMALSKLQMMFSIAEVVSIVEGADKVGPSDRDIAGSWFHRFTTSVTDDKTWRENFRMSKPTFGRLLESLRPALQRHQDDDGGDEAEPGAPSVPADFRLGAAIFRLAHGATFKHVGRKFGIGTASARKAFHDVCRAVEHRLSHLFEFPSSPESLHAVIDKFESIHLPNCCGVIGYTRFDPQGTQSVVMQGLVDSDARFLDLSVGWRGSVTPTLILPRTRLYARVESTGELLQGHAAELLNGTRIPQYIIGDRSCPLYEWLLTPYYPRDAPVPFLTPAQEIFNSVHDYAMSAIWRAFGMLKAQWKLLTVRQRGDSTEFFPHTVVAACILHNFLINSGEPMPDVQEVTENDFPLAHERNEVAESVRDALASHIRMAAGL